MAGPSSLEHTASKERSCLFVTAETFEDDKQRDAAHPHCFTEVALINLFGDNFEFLFHNKSPWISLSRYTEGIRDAENFEIVLVMKLKE